VKIGQIVTSAIRARSFDGSGNLEITWWYNFAHLFDQTRWVEMTPGQGRQSGHSLRADGKRARSSRSQTSRHQQATQAPANLGVVYLCIGQKYQRLAEMSISFLRAFGYSGPVRVLTAGKNWKLGHLDCEIIKVPFRGLGFATRYYKTRINQYGFETTLFLDADTLPVANVRPIWHELRFADICLSRDLHPQVRDLIKRHYSDRKRCRPEYYYMGDLGLMQHRLYSSGVMLFRRSLATDRLFEAWHEEWNRFRHEDQLALVRAIARTKPPVHDLTRRWNGWQTWFESISQAQNSGVRILHNVHKGMNSEFLDDTLMQLVDSFRPDFVADGADLVPVSMPENSDSTAGVDGRHEQ